MKYNIPPTNSYRPHTSHIQLQKLTCEHTTSHIQLQKLTFEPFPPPTYSYRSWHLNTPHLPHTATEVDIWTHPTSHIQLQKLTFEDTHLPHTDTEVDIWTHPTFHIQLQKLTFEHTPPSTNRYRSWHLNTPTSHIQLLWMSVERHGFIITGLRVRLVAILVQVVLILLRLLDVNTWTLAWRRAALALLLTQFCTAFSEKH